MMEMKSSRSRVSVVKANEFRYKLTNFARDPDEGRKRFSGATRRIDRAADLSTG